MSPGHPIKGYANATVALISAAKDWTAQHEMESVCGDNVILIFDDSPNAALFLKTR